MLEPGDIIIDGGNSYYRDDIDRAEELQAEGHPLRRRRHQRRRVRPRTGYCLMIGGEDDVVEHLDPIFAPRPRRRRGAAHARARRGDRHRPSTGYLHCGPTAPATS